MTTIRDVERRPGFQTLTSHIIFRELQPANDLWEKLSKGGEKEQCGSLNDRFPPNAGLYRAPTASTGIVSLVFE